MDVPQQIANNKINKLHERAFRRVYNDRQSTFEELLDKNKSVSVRHRNLQVLAIEMYKVYSNVSPDIMNNIFEKNPKYYLTLGTVVILFQGMLNLCIIDQKQCHIQEPKYEILYQRILKPRKKLSVSMQNLSFGIAHVDYIKFACIKQVLFDKDLVQSRINVREFERFDSFMFFVKTTDNQKLTDVFKGNAN